jgi:hypothetical protein
MRVGKSAGAVMSMRLDAAARTSALAIRAAGDPAALPRFLIRLSAYLGAQPREPEAQPERNPAPARTKHSL